MNNRFKFRIWHKKQNKFIDPPRYEHLDYYKTTGLCLIDCSGYLRVANYPIGNGDNSADSVFTEINKEDYIIQQYTGLNDSLNNEIYEGDIIEMTYDYIIERGFVVWENNSYILKTIGEDSYAPLVIFPKDKVIGNIYENPELLKKHENQKQKSQE